MVRSTAQAESAASCDRSTNGDPDAFCLDKPTRYWFGFRATDRVDAALQILEGAIGTLGRFTANNEDMPDTFAQSVRVAIQQATEDLQGHRAELKRNAEGVFKRFLITDACRNYADPLDYVIPLLRRCSLHELHCMGDELRIRFEREEREFKRSLAASDDADDSDATPTAAQPPETASQPMVAGKPAESTPAADPAPAEPTDTGTKVEAAPLVSDARTGCYPRTPEGRRALAIHEVCDAIAGCARQFADLHRLATTSCELFDYFTDRCDYPDPELKTVRGLFEKLRDDLLNNAKGATEEAKAARRDVLVGIDDAEPLPVFDDDGDTQASDSTHKPPAATPATGQPDEHGNVFRPSASPAAVVGNPLADKAFAVISRLHYSMDQLEATGELSDALVGAVQYYITNEISIPQDEVVTIIGLAGRVAQDLPTLRNDLIGNVREVERLLKAGDPSKPRSDDKDGAPETAHAEAVRA